MDKWTLKTRRQRDIRGIVISDLKESWFRSLKDSMQPAINVFMVVIVNKLHHKRWSADNLLTTEDPFVPWWTSCSFLYSYQVFLVLWSKNAVNLRISRLIVKICKNTIKFKVYLTANLLSWVQNFYWTIYRRKQSRETTFCFELVSMYARRLLEDMTAGFEIPIIGYDQKQRLF